MAAYYDPGSTANRILDGAEVYRIGSATIVVLATTQATTAAFWSSSLWEGWERRGPRRLQLPELAPLTKPQKCLARKLTFRTYVRSIPRGKPGKTRPLPRVTGTRRSRKEMVWRVRGIARDP